MSFVPKLLASLRPRGKYQKILHGTLLCLKHGSLHLGHSACTLYSPLKRTVIYTSMKYQFRNQVGLNDHFGRMQEDNSLREKLNAISASSLKKPLCSQRDRKETSKIGELESLARSMLNCYEEDDYQRAFLTNYIALVLKMFHVCPKVTWFPHLNPESNCA